MKVCLKCETTLRLCKCSKVRKKKPQKYRNEKSGGFQSKKEERRYKELILLEKAGVISRLEKQPAFILQESFRDIRAGKLKDGTPAMVRQIKYTGDFKYLEHGVTWVVEDVKSDATRKEKAYRIRVRLFLAKYKRLDFREL